MEFLVSTVAKFPDKSMCVHIENDQNQHGQVPVEI